MHDATSPSALIDQLQTTLSKMVLALELVNDAIAWTKPDGSIQWCNPAFERLVGTERTVCGQRLSQVLPLTLQGKPVPLLLLATDGASTDGQLHQGRYGFCRHDRQLTLNITLSPLPGVEVHASNAVGSGVMLVIQDVSELPSESVPELLSEARSLPAINLAPEATLPTSTARIDPADQRMLTILESMTDGFFVLDEHWCFTYLNQQAAQWLQRSRTDLLGNHIWQCFPEAVGSVSHQEYNRAINTQSSVAFETFYPPLNAWFEVRAYPAAKGLAVYFQDISERKHLELERQRIEAALRESEQRFRYVFTTTAVCTAITSLDGAHLQVNVAYCQAVGYTEAELLARTFQQITHPDDVTLGLSYVQKLLAGEMAACQFEKRFFHKAGHIVWGLMSLLLVRDMQQQPLYFVAQVQTIDDRKQAELALQQLNQALEQRVQNRTAALEQANQQLQAEITDHKQTETALRKSEERFRAIFDHAPIAISLADIHTYRIAKVNQAHRELFGYSDAELATMTHVDLTYPADVNTNLAKVKQLLDGTIDRFQLEKRFIKKNGTWIWAHLTVTLFRDPDGRTYSMGMIEDINDRKRSEEALKLTQFSIDRAVDPIWWVEPDGTIHYVNDAACRDLGYTRDRIIGKRVSDFNPELPQTAWDNHWQTIKVQGSSTFEACVQASSGTLFPVEVTANYIELNGKEYHCSFVRNITDRKRSEAERKHVEAQLRASLQEKEVLLKEIHHRVKNNLQTVYSLLNLQADSIQDPAILTLFRDSQHRVKVMALIHEKLYQSESLARVNFADYVHNLATDLIYSYSANPANIQLCIEISAVELSVDVAIPCGFIINELVANSIKYAFPDNAFPDNQAGTIRICFSLSETNHWLLIVADNGVGLSTAIDWHATDSLGLQLVHAFAYRLRGTLELDRSGGTAFKLSFPSAL